MNWLPDSPLALAAATCTGMVSLTVWFLGRQGPQGRAVQVWALGGVLAALASALLGVRGGLPAAVGASAAASLSAAALLLQGQALRVHCDAPSLARWLLPAWWLVCLVNLAGLAGPDRQAFGTVVAVSVFNSLALAAGAALLTWQALQAAVRQRSRAALLLALSTGLAAAVFLLRGLGMVLGWWTPGLAEGEPDQVLVHAAAALVGLYGNLGFLGMVLDATRRAEAEALDAEVAERTQRENAEEAQQSLAALLVERDRLAGERERLLRLLAHEIRQPLHNASGALQATSQTLQQPSPAADGPHARQARQGLQEAEAVLDTVRSVLDNTLAAATLLSRSAPLETQEVALEFLVALALGDLDAARRSRVQVQWHTDQRVVEVEPGLLRLALRNLLVNAFRHGGPGVSVQLQLAEQDQPPALLLRVVDDGPGLPAAACQPGDALQAGPQGQASPPNERRMGLRVVAQVAALHGGQLALLPQQPHGLAAMLVLPLPGAENPPSD